MVTAGWVVFERATDTTDEPNTELPSGAGGGNGSTKSTYSPCGEWPAAATVYGTVPSYGSK